MFCGECGTENAETRKFCKNCGKPLRSATPAPGVQPPAVPVPAPQPVSAPVAPPPPVHSPPPPVSAPPPAGTPAPARPPLNKGLLGLGIAGLLIALVAWFRYPYLCGLLAIVLGVLVIARSDNRKGAVALVAALAILIGLAAIIVDLFYFTIFPVHDPVF